MRRQIVVLLVLAVAALWAVAGTASAARKSCGSVRPNSPPFNSGVTSFKVTVVKGTITCAQADKLFTHFYTTPGTESAGSNGTSIEHLNNGFTCSGGGFSGTASVPIICTKGRDEVKAVG